MSVKDQVLKVRNSLVAHENVRVVAAVKYFDINKTKEIIEAGITDIGENRKDSFLEKYEALKDYPITWHYFGIIKIPPKLKLEFPFSTLFFPLNPLRICVIALIMPKLSIFLNS